ncbi:growth-regulating factor 6-like isoform X1 [Musa acuminata AAA Group]|uniref:growth-regulating factor 6-like isoform X1 n=1 Tax=Musa acuminata AAA Group TaxID=214697 RepID=UPI0031E21166
MDAAMAGGVSSSSMASSDTELSRQSVLLGSSFQHNGSGSEAAAHDMRCVKMAPVLIPYPGPLFPDGEQMLSFSSASGQASMMLNLDRTLPYYQHHPSASTSSTSSFLRNAGLDSGNFDVNMHGVRGPFAPSQWLELERQALIYKYIVAYVAIPPNLLIPIRTSLSPSGFSPFSVGSFGSSTLGWGSYHQRYTGNDDLEPGRCRRTDGKKWRCSKDAVADQRYCERHLNRGRHRSRKRVEGCTRHGLEAIAIVPLQSASAISGSRTSDNLPTSQHQAANLETNINDCCPAQFDRMPMSKGNVNERAQESECLSMRGFLRSRPMSDLFPVSEEHNPFEETPSGVELGHVSMDSLFNDSSSTSSDNISSYITTANLNDQQKRPHPLQCFNDESDHSNISWSGVEMQSDRTQSSISFPMACSPCNSSAEYDPINVGLRVGVPCKVSKCQTGWLPISPESSMAGPLGEVLNRTSSTIKQQINFLTDSCDFSPWLESSPTGVLQKVLFGSVSSSTRSSPGAENSKSHKSNGSLCEDVFGSTLEDLHTIPS